MEITVCVRVSEREVRDIERAINYENERERVQVKVE